MEDLDYVSGKLREGPEPREPAPEWKRTVLFEIVGDAFAHGRRRLSA